MKHLAVEADDEDDDLDENMNKIRELKEISILFYWSI